MMELMAVILAWLGGACTLAVLFDIRRKEVDTRTYQCGACAVWAAAFVTFLVTFYG